MVVKHSLRFKMMAMGLKLAGHKKVADMITSSWKVWHPSLSASLSHPHEALEQPSEFRLSMWSVSCSRGCARSGLQSACGTVYTARLDVCKSLSTKALADRVALTSRCGSCTTPRLWTSTCSSAPSMRLSCRWES